MEPMEEERVAQGQASAVDDGAAHTVYVRNIFERMKIEEVKKCMRTIFEQFGPVIEVHARRTYKLRGQAWVVFERGQDAEAAVKLIQGFPFYGKPLMVALAKSQSDAWAKTQGIYSEDYVHQRRLAAEEARNRLAKRQEEEEAVNTAAAAVAASVGLGVPVPAPVAANKILFVENVPAEADDSMLGVLFSKHPGFVEVRTVPQRPGIAFVEYGTEAEAGVALQALQGFKMATGVGLRITFAKQ